MQSIRRAMSLRRLLFGWVCLSFGIVLSQAIAADGAPEAVLIERENVVEVEAGAPGWKPARLGHALAVRERLRTGEFSRAAVRFTDLSMLRLDELTTIEISPPVAASSGAILRMQQGGTYFFSREKADQIQIRTPAVNGALRGTEFDLRVAANGKTRLTMFEGEVELRNAHGSLRLLSGEQGEVEVGRAPRKTAMIEAANIIQWCLYYPAVLDPSELGLNEKEQREQSKALAAYRSGNLLLALQSYSRSGSNSPNERVFRAALALAVGQVDAARMDLGKVPVAHSGRRALEQLIAAVKKQTLQSVGHPVSGSEWLAESYYKQSHGNLPGARDAARRATELKPQFGFAWTRLAELEFSFGRTSLAVQALERSLELAPENAQAHALHGFVLSAQNRMGAAHRSFEKAIQLDGALGNAWLGRGLSAIRQGRELEGRRDLQVAAALEPNRSIFRSYLGKAFSEVGNSSKANVEFQRAKELDPQDPTPWLYSAIQRKRENRYNSAVDDLERSIEMNENRRLYRSNFLLDQDRAIRGTNLAAIYLNNGMVEQSLREAVRAVNDDYGSAPAHLFLSDSYKALLDPNGILTRYETGWFNERLLAHLLSPVGGGPLSQYVSEQEYSRLFEKDGLGISSLTEYFSDGRVRQVGSQFGTYGNVSYALDAEYYYDNGGRPNSRRSSFEGFSTFKLQVTPADTVFFQAQYSRAENGDVFQRYDPSEVGRESSVEVPTEAGGLAKVVTKNRSALTYDFSEEQNPGLLLAGWHHEWSPGNHTLLLLGRLENESHLRVEDASFPVITQDLSAVVLPEYVGELGQQTTPRETEVFDYLRTLEGRGVLRRFNQGTYDLDYRSRFQTYSAELQQILTLGSHTAILGGRVQRGEFNTQVRLSDYANGQDAFGAILYQTPPAKQDVTVDLERLSFYAYDVWRAASWLTLTGGVVYDSLDYPQNYNAPPINERQASLDAVSPKAGLIIEPWKGGTIRGAYTESISGTSYDESVRLEPVQVSGFLQSFRSLAPETTLGTTAGSKYKLLNASFEQKLPTRTYLGLEYNLLQQDVDRSIGVFNDHGAFGIPIGVLPGSLPEKVIYREDVLTASVNQLIDQQWSLGARYRFTHSKLRQQRGGLEDALSRELKDDLQLLYDQTRLIDLARQAEQTAEADFHEIRLHALINHPSGFFARAEANWYRQENDHLTTSLDLPHPEDTGSSNPRGRRRPENLGLPGEDFWHFNVFAGYRFYRNQCELSCGLLNISDADYRLDSLSPHLELPRDRTLVLRCKLTF